MVREMIRFYSFFKTNRGDSQCPEWFSGSDNQNESLSCHPVF